MVNKSQSSISGRVSALCLPALLSLTIAGCSHPVTTTADYRVVPLPSVIETTDSSSVFTLSDATEIVVEEPGDSALLKNAELFAGYISDITDITPGSKSRKNVIVLRKDLPDPSADAYTVDVTADSIIVRGASAAGNFYGLQTLRKAIDASVEGATEVSYPAVHIYDAPRFAYRGAHFDTSRHFFTPDSLKIFIDMLALHNVNRFHWHLTDDQGWRIEIKSRPELAEKGQWRSGTITGDIHEDDCLNTYDSIPYGGYYTQDQVRDIVAYAADRHITVIPEIDMPGHMQAALATYPELGCTGGPYEVWRRWGVSEDVLCAGNDSVYKFIEDVLGEIVDLFPGEYIHIGGDECPKVRWTSCPKCQAKIRELGLKSDSRSTAEQKLQTYFMSRASEFLSRHGRKVIGWNEMLEGGLPEGAVVMSWTGIGGAVEAARQGHDAILTPCGVCYFDFVQSEDPSEPRGANWGHPTTVEAVYNFDPAPAELTPEQLHHILGVQSNLWCEYITTMSHAQYMELPRLAALSEVQWCSGDAKDYDDFISRLTSLTGHYDAMGYNYARHALPAPEK